MLGKKHKKETKEKIRQSHLGKKLGPHSIETRNKIRMANTGKTHSMKTKQKISEHNKKRKMRRCEKTGRFIELVV